MSRHSICTDVCVDPFHIQPCLTVHSGALHLLGPEEIKQAGVSLTRRKTSKILRLAIDRDELWSDDVVEFPASCFAPNYTSTEVMVHP